MKAGRPIAGGKPRGLPCVRAASGKAAGGGQAEKFSGQSVGLGKSWCSQEPVGFMPSLLSEMLERSRSF